MPSRKSVYEDAILYGATPSFDFKGDTITIRIKAPPGHYWKRNGSHEIIATGPKSEGWRQVVESANNGMLDGLAMCNVDNPECRSANLWFDETDYGPSWLDD